MITGNRASMHDSVQSMMDSQLSMGLQLAAMPDRVMYEDERKGIRVTMGELLEGEDNIAEDQWKLAGTALMLENTRKWLANMDETTRLVNVGDFQKYAFNMVRALFPSLAAHELFSVQPMAGPVSLVFFMKFVYALTKGSAVAGQDLIENPNQSYSSEIIDAEQWGVGTGAASSINGNAAFTPVKPGTVSVQYTIGGVAYTAQDNGNGVFTGTDLTSTNTINYVTGAYVLTWSSDPDAATTIVAQYTYSFEANDELPAVDMTLTSAPVSAVTRKLRTRWSVEAMQDLKNLHGLDAEIEQVAGITSELKFEIDREVIRNAQNIALNSTAAFNVSPSGSNVSFTEHKLLMVDKMLQGSNAIFQSTQRAVATWGIGGTNWASLIESLPGFVSFGKPANTRGVYKTGRLNGQWDIWKDPTFPAIGAGYNTYNPNGYFLGYKGTSMWEIGYIFAPYILAFTTPTVMLDDLVGRKAIASRYGQRAIDGRFFCTGSITGNSFSGN